MRPSPGVTSLQYFLISSAQEFSSFAASAANFSWIAFPISVCADAAPIDRITGKAKSPSLASKCIVFFIDRPLMTGSQPSPNGFAEVAAGSQETKNCLRRAARLLLISSLRQRKRETRNSKRKIDSDRPFD